MQGTSAAAHRLNRRSRREHRPLPDSTLYARDYLLSDVLDGFAAYEDGGVNIVRAREIDLLDVLPGERALDLGSGRGETTAEMVRRGAVVTALDYSWDAAVLTHELVGTTARVLQANGVQLPFADESFDCVLLSDVVEHVPWPMAEQMLTEVHRVLTPRGRALIHTAPNTWFITVVKRPLVVLLRLTKREAALWRFAEYDRLRDAMHPNELSPVTFRKLMKRTPFHAVTFVDRDVLRAGKSTWTERWPTWLVTGLERICGAWPFRLLLGNDMYAVAACDPRDFESLRTRRPWTTTPLGGTS